MLCNNHVFNHHIIGTNYTKQPYRQLGAICKAVESNYELFDPPGLSLVFPLAI